MVGWRRWGGASAFEICGGWKNRCIA